MLFHTKKLHREREREKEMDVREKNIQYSAYKQLFIFSFASPHLHSELVQVYPLSDNED